MLRKNPKKRRVNNSTQRGVMTKVSAAAAQQRPKSPAGDRLCPGTPDAVTERDPGRPCFKSPNSRQSRDANRPASSHLQGRDSAGAIIVYGGVYFLAQ